MVIRTRILAAAGAAMLLTSSFAHAESKQLVVTSATVDRANDTVTLKGQGFGPKKPVVFAEMTPMAVLSVSDEELLVSFPASSLDGTFLFTVVRGAANNDRASFYVTTTRPQILEGKEGPMGPQGAAGPAGPQGEKGETGPQGPQGERGLQGERGPQGLTGETGAQGPKGDTRATGAQGAVGPQGAEGPQGPAGPQGAQGPAGPQGVAGPQGPQGLQGLIGLQGPQGAPGVSGYERVVGDSGPLQIGGFISSSVIAACPAGKRAIAGGHELASVSAQGLNVTMSAPYENGVSGWKVAFRNPTANPLMSAQVKAHVICVSLQ